MFRNTPIRLSTDPRAGASSDSVILCSRSNGVPGSIVLSDNDSAKPFTSLSFAFSNIFFIG